MNTEAEYREVEGDIVPYDDAPDDAVVAYSPLDSTEYMVTAAGSAQALIESQEPTDAKPSDPSERLTTVQDRFHFVPLSKTELSDVYDVTAKELVGGAAQHLNVVLNRQKKYMEEPQRTVRAIVDRYTSYAENAQREAAFLMMAQEEVQKSEAHPFARADSVSAISVWKHEPSVSRPLLAVLQQRDIDAFMRDSDIANPLERQEATQERIYSAGNKNTMARLEKMLQGMRVSELAGDLQQNIAIQKHRFDFWVDVLKQSEKHSLARGMVHKALVDLRVSSVQ